jgi:multidrug efflux pump subunit AcrA (membrane-fusion protein)
MSARIRSLCLALLMILVSLPVAGCGNSVAPSSEGASSSSSGSSGATPTPIPAPAVAEKPTYTVQRGEVVNMVEFTGRVSPSVEESLFFRQDGRVKVVNVERNDMVEVGTVLAELENDDIVRQLAQAQIELETAQDDLTTSEADTAYQASRTELTLQNQQLQLSKLQQSLEGAKSDVELAQLHLEDVKNGASPEELAVAQSQLEQAKNSLWSAQVRRDATCGQTKEADCDAAQATVQNAEEAVRIATINLQQLQDAPTEQDLAAAQAAYDGAVEAQKQAELDIQIQQNTITLTQMELDRLKSQTDSQLTAAVERAQLTVDRLQAQVEETQVISPIAGRVTSVGAYAGRSATAYNPVFIVADDSQLEIRADPVVSQLELLREGMTCSLELTAYPGRPIEGEITVLPYPYGSGGGSNVEDVDTSTHISFDPGDLSVEAGDVVNITVSLEKKEDVLWLPPAAIRTFSGRNFVVVQDADGQQHRVDVVIGIESDERVEIEMGLEEGQIVVGQ